jgi:hypothetical protein
MSRLLLIGVMTTLLVAPSVAVQAEEDSEKPSGYVVILKNGEKIRCMKPMEIKGNLAILTLVTRQVTSYPLSFVDLVETERYNQMGFGDAIMIEELTMQGAKPVPTPTPRPTLGQLATISSGTEDDATLSINVEPTPVPTPNIKLQSESYHDSRVESAFSTIFDARKVYLYRMSAGTESEYFFIRAVTGNQKEVFHVLGEVCRAYDTILTLQPEVAPAAVELEMVETSGKAAGTFRLFPEDIKPLIDGEIPVERFYVDHVIF